jgi:thiol reductant ABC exporter CydD subunit
MLLQAGWRLLRRETGALKQLLFAVVLGGLGGIVQVLQAWLIAVVINRAFLTHQTTAELMTPLAGLLGTVLARAILTYWSSNQAHFAALEIKHALRTRLFGHLLALGPAWMKRGNTAELTEACTAGIDSLEVFLGEYLPRLAWAALIPLTILVVVFPQDSLTGVILLLTAPLIPIFMWLIGSLANRLAGKQWRLLNRMSSHFLDILQGLDTLVRFNRSRAQVEAIALVSERFRHTTMRVLQVAFLSALTLEMVATLSTAVIAVEICVRLLGGKILFQQALFLLILAPEFYQPLRALSASYHASTSGIQSLRRMLALLDEQPEETAGDQVNIPVPHKNIGMHATPPFTIRFDEVAFRHPETAQNTVEGISFTLQPGQHTALVGPSGAGKSTLFDLLLGFITPHSGRITVNGAPLSSLYLPAWRAQIAWAPQGPALFNTTILENIRFGVRDAQVPQVAAAARLAQADAFITQLPQGYDTSVGERGMRLSGGQVGRIALARALVRNAPILLLDEISAHLDSTLEQAIYHNLASLRPDLTLVSIAHRAPTAAAADHIIVLDQGRILEQGAPTELLKNNDGPFNQQMMLTGPEGLL